MNTQDTIIRRLLELGAVPLKDFLAAPYTYPRKPVDNAISAAELLTSGPSSSANMHGSVFPEVASGKTLATASAGPNRRNSKRKREDKPAQAAMEAEGIELEEGELVEEKKSKNQKKKARKRARMLQELGDGAVSGNGSLLHA